jgi:RES domain-containing protein
MRLYRLGTAAFPIWDGGGAAAMGGRWNPPGVAVIYAAGSLALAVLERLVQRREFRDTLLVEAAVPADVAVEDLLAAPPANWRALGSPEAVSAGGEWAASRRTALLRVPSALVPREPNYLVNPAHPDAARIAVGMPEGLAGRAGMGFAPVWHPGAAVMPVRHGAAG